MPPPKRKQTNVPWMLWHLFCFELGEIPNQKGWRNNEDGHYQHLRLVLTMELWYFPILSATKKHPQWILLPPMTPQSPQQTLLHCPSSINANFFSAIPIFLPCFLMLSTPALQNTFIPYSRNRTPFQPFYRQSNAGEGLWHVSLIHFFFPKDTTAFFDNRCELIIHHLTIQRDNRMLEVFWVLTWRCSSNERCAIKSKSLLTLLNWICRSWSWPNQAAVLFSSWWRTSCGNNFVHIWDDYISRTRFRFWKAFLARSSGWRPSFVTRLFLLFAHFIVPRGLEPYVLMPLMVSN